VFEEVIPGNYKLLAHPIKGVTFSKQEQECEIKLNTKKSCNDVRLQISGYELSGAATIYDSPLSDVSVFLYSENISPEGDIKDSPLSGKTAVRRTETDSQGRYSFSNIPNGDF